MLPHAYLASEQYARLSPRACKALIDIAAQYTGRNNGDLDATWSRMRRRGWSSLDQLYKAIGELLERGWIITTRKGGRDRKMPTLYAVTWWGIDECGGKLDPGIAPTAAPLNLWKHPDRLSLPSTKARRSVKRLLRPTELTAPPNGANIIAIKADQSAMRIESGTFPGGHRSA